MNVIPLQRRWQIRLFANAFHYCLFCSPYAMPSERVKQGSSDVGMSNMVHSCALASFAASQLGGGDDAVRSLLASDRMVGGP
jgi:hypothetical protein